MLTTSVQIFAFSWSGSCLWLSHRYMSHSCIALQPSQIIATAEITHNPFTHPAGMSRPFLSCAPCRGIISTIAAQTYLRQCTHGFWCLKRAAERTWHCCCHCHGQIHRCHRCNCQTIIFLQAWVMWAMYTLSVSPESRKRTMKLMRQHKPCTSTAGVGLRTLLGMQRLSKKDSQGSINMYAESGKSGGYQVSPALA